jgi:hypothetical protein
MLVLGGLNDFSQRCFFFGFFFGYPDIFLDSVFITGAQPFILRSSQLFFFCLCLPHLLRPSSMLALPMGALRLAVLSVIGRQVCVLTPESYL